MTPWASQLPIMSALAAKVTRWENARISVSVFVTEPTTIPWPESANPPRLLMMSRALVSQASIPEKSGR